MLFSLAVANSTSKVEGQPLKWTVFDQTRWFQRLKMDDHVLYWKVQITFSGRPRSKKRTVMKWNTGRFKDKTGRSVRIKVNENLERSMAIQTGSNDCSLSSMGVWLKWPSTFWRIVYFKNRPRSLLQSTLDLRPSTLDKQLENRESRRKTKRRLRFPSCNSNKRSSMYGKISSWSLSKKFRAVERLGRIISPRQESWQRSRQPNRRYF